MDLPALRSRRFGGDLDARASRGIEHALGRVVERRGEVRTAIRNGLMIAAARCHSCGDQDEDAVRALRSVWRIGAFPNFVGAVVLACIGAVAFSIPEANPHDTAKVIAVMWIGRVGAICLLGGIGADFRTAFEMLRDHPNVEWVVRTHE